jgi:hypothetical protein
MVPKAPIISWTTRLQTKRSRCMCIYSQNKGAFIILAVWADDGLLAFNDHTGASATIIHHLQNKYKMTCTPAEHFVGLVVNHGRQNRKL